MKMDKNTKRLIAIATISFIAFATVAFAAYQIYSNIVPVTVNEYSLSLSVTPTSIVRYHNVTFTATLHGPDISGKTIVFYRTDSAGNIVETLGSNNTDASGIAIFTWNMTYSAETYNFKAGYEVP
jgi:hypothetical protein